MNKTKIEKNSQNCSKDKSCFMTNDHQLLDLSIGKTNGGNLSFRYNRTNKQFKYYKTYQQHMQVFTLLDTKLKRWAFNKIQKGTYYYRQHINTVFLPEALQTGDNQTVSKLLEKIKNNKIQGYIKMHIQQTKGFFSKSGSIIKKLSKIVNQRLRQAFNRIKNIKQNGSKMILQGLDFSSIDQENVSFSDKSTKKWRRSSVKIQYKHIKLQKSLQKSYVSDKKRNTRANVQQLDLKQLINNSKFKQYQFQVKTNRISTQRWKGRVKQYIF